jgi:hypothetical protein
MPTRMIADPPEEPPAPLPPQLPPILTVVDMNRVRASVR